MKRGQITVFLILAIIVIVVAAAIYYIQTSDFESEIDRQFFESAEIKPQVDNIESSLLNCVNEVSKSALVFIGIQGGHYNEPKKHFKMKGVFIPYYYYEGGFLMPSKEMVESELGNYVDDNLVLCIDELDFEGFELDYSVLETEVSIGPQEVSFVVDMPIKIKKEDKKIIFDLEKYPVVSSSLLYEILEVAEYITDSHKEDPEMMCLSCIENLADERELYVDFITFDESTILTVISENITSSEPYSFEFLNKYTGDERSPESEITLGVPDAPDV